MFKMKELNTNIQYATTPSEEGKVARVSIISSSETYSLRLEVLWQHKNSLEECKLDIDDMLTTFHVGVFKNNEIVAIGTFLQQQNEKFDAKNQYRLRAMATSPKVRGENFGKQVIDFALEELKNRKVDLLWCDARKVALGFYEKMGFNILGDFYEVPIIGKHKLMYKRI